MNKKAQTGIEYMSTYVWALIILIFIVGLFAFFFFVVGDEQVPDSCVFDQGIICTESGPIYQSKQILATLTNQQNFDITVTEVSIDYFGIVGGCTQCDALNNYCGLGGEWKNGQKKSLTIPCNVAETDKPNIEVTIKFRPEDSDYIRGNKGVIKIGARS